MTYIPSSKGPAPPVLAHHPSAADLLRPDDTDLHTAEQHVIDAARNETDAENRQASLMRALTARRGSPILAAHDESARALQAAHTARREAVRQLEQIEATINGDD